MLYFSSEFNLVCKLMWSLSTAALYFILCSLIKKIQLIYSKLISRSLLHHLILYILLSSWDFFSRLLLFLIRWVFILLVNNTSLQIFIIWLPSLHIVDRLILYSLTYGFYYHLISYIQKENYNLKWFVIINYKYDS